MTTRIISKQLLSTILKKWIKSYDVYAPVKVKEFTQFKKINDIDESLFNSYFNTRYPPKAQFLPQSETLFRNTEGQLTIPIDKPGRRIVLGIRPCDAHAVSLLDTVFDTQKDPDSYWKNRRSNTLVIALGCSSPQETCFCTAVGSGPFDSHGADVLLTELNDQYYLNLLTPDGEDLFKEAPQASAEQAKQAQKVKVEAEKQIHKPFDAKGIREQLYSLFESDFWQQIQQSCMGCGICTFLCPTCFCFDIVDEVQRGERVRNWDTCMFRVYSQEASGHNPRPTKAERTRQRIMHKFAYWIDNINEIGCTGCGRCVQYCPVNLDIRHIISSAQSYKIASVGGKR